MRLSVWSTDAPGHKGRPELIVRSTPALSETSHLRWRARCSCGWVGPTEYLATAAEPVCPPTTRAVTKSEWEEHRAQVDVVKLTRRSIKPTSEARQFPLLHRTLYGRVDDDSLATTSGS